MDSLPDFKNWRPLSIRQIKELLPSNLWILAGGYALALFYGQHYRSHEDIDILIDRKDQYLLSKYIEKDRLFIAYKGQFEPFSLIHYYEKPVQDIWLLGKDRRSWSLQIMLFDTAESHWIYKRNENISLLLKAIYFKQKDIMVLKPEIQLLYKSSSIRKKDQLDFDKIYPILSQTAKNWLQTALEICYGSQHIWIN